MQRALQLHPEREEFWIRASLWEFDHNKDADAARVFLERGIRYSSKNMTLWKALYKLELLAGLKASEDNKEIFEKVTTRILEKVVEHATSAMMKNVVDEQEQRQIKADVRQQLFEMNQEICQDK